MCVSVVAVMLRVEEDFEGMDWGRWIGDEVGLGRETAGVVGEWFSGFDCGGD